VFAAAPSSDLPAHAARYAATFALRRFFLRVELIDAFGKDSHPDVNQALPLLVD
jgi:hypothetical protein